MGNTTLIGNLDFDDTGSKPKLSGSLELPALDLRPFLGEKPAKENAAPPRSLAEVYRSLSVATFDLKQLNSADADLTLGVGQWLSLPGDVKDVTLQIKLKDGILQAPVKASIAGVALSGSATPMPMQVRQNSIWRWARAIPTWAAWPNCCSA